MSHKIRVNRVNTIKYSLYGCVFALLAALSILLMSYFFILYIIVTASDRDDPTSGDLKDIWINDTSRPEYTLNALGYHKD